MLAFANIDNIIADWLVKNNNDTTTYIPVVFSASFTGLDGSIYLDYSIQSLISNSVIIVQSVSNVTAMLNIAISKNINRIKITRISM